MSERYILEQFERDKAKREEEARNRPTHKVRDSLVHQ
jgi:hypothetical protein